MISKVVALIQAPNRRLFSVAAAVHCLSKAIGMIRKLANLNTIESEPNWTRPVVVSPSPWRT